ncbi:MAG: hypothetical protein ACJAXQ_000686, partial [Parvibaculaceae bacterium]
MCALRRRVLDGLNSSSPLSFYRTSIQLNALSFEGAFCVWGLEGWLAGAGGTTQAEGLICVGVRCFG